ncbi:MAG: hypothetical protein AMJ43_07770 [Coxiella sp. DG_40]|nr:MAG: hypothetical protein AMJ43_07770 [Coxiella sp. DG_40]
MTKEQYPSFSNLDNLQRDLRRLTELRDRDIEEDIQLNEKLYKLGLSTTEFQTFRLFNDSVIYTKVIDLTKTFLETDSTNIAHSISDLDVVISSCGMVKSSSIWYNLPYIDISSAEKSYYKIDSTNIVSVVEGSPSWTGFSEGHLILEYTRS